MLTNLLKMGSIKRHRLLFLFFYIFIQLEVPFNFSYVRQSSAASINYLPFFDAIDILGTPISSHQYIGKIIVVEFVDPDQIDELYTFKKLLIDFGYRAELQRIVFVKKKNGFESYLNPNSNVRIIDKDYNKYRNLFKVPTCCDAFFLFDSSGILSYTDIYSYDIIKGLLIKTIDYRYFRIEDYAKTGSNIDSVVWLKQIAKQIKEGTFRYYLVAFLRSICNSCPSGSIVRRLNGYNTNLLKSLLVLPQTFSKNDIANLIINLKINCETIIANDNLENKWNQFIKEFNQESTWALIILFDNKGNILRTADPNCDCFEELYQYIESSIKRKE